MTNRILNTFIRPQVLVVVICLSIFPALMSQASAADVAPTYEYDDLRRVTPANYGNGDVLIAYEYDDAGNRHEKSASLKDTDSDDMPDYWEKIYSLNWNNSGDAGQDAEGDGLSNLAEYNHRTDPTNSDTDGDNWTDGAEVDAGTNPLDPNSHPTGGHQVPAMTTSGFALTVLLLLGTGAIGIKRRKEAMPSLCSRGANTGS